MPKDTGTCPLCGGQTLGGTVYDSGFQEERCLSCGALHTYSDKGWGWRTPTGEFQMEWEFPDLSPEKSQEERG